MKNQILDLEKKYWKAMENHDFDTVRSLTRFPCIVAGKNGVRSVDEPSFKKMFDSAEGNQLKVLSISETESEIIGEDIAVVAYLVELAYSAKGQGSTEKCVCTSTWVKQQDSWVCAMHTESELKK
ncbi:nuclear transport factor 2 family protein [Pedobacter africanus]|uniref:DUF4440 domain-containing protein n=1 Tax=Pedobacter africanus TaxID=151894 RepID=A0A1W2CXC3_9SPHI|nr:nuclear transport factor 2 family protein [Pedobacter africanus]SMC89544.1 protein of unknown function [Pedobacter africanus]